MSGYHIPVMLSETLKFLDVQNDHWYIDCNLGGGGHTEGILERGGKVLGIDLDPDAIKEVSQKFNLKKEEINLREFFVSENLMITRDNFSNIDSIVKDADLPQIYGILFDLGVSSHQLEEKTRGFSFNADASLDMRMDKTSAVTAKDLINGLHEGELSDLFWKLGEEHFAKKIAKKIIEARQKLPITTTDQLAKIILSVRPRTPADRTHPATRVFQALRIAVNDELNSLREALPKALEVLTPGGRIVVISFHSLEDRIVKNAFKYWGEEGKVKILTEKPIETSEEEYLKNPRSRSGKLRAIEKNKTW